MIIGTGLLSAFAGGIIPVFTGQPFLTGMWVNPVIFGTEVHLGTPLLFDLGVYLVVIGVILTIIYSLEEERSEEHTSELQSRGHIVCRLLLEKKNKTTTT